jgi:hypothetical protein
MVTGSRGGTLCSAGSRGCRSRTSGYHCRRGQRPLDGPAARPGARGALGIRGRVCGGYAAGTSYRRSRCASSLVPDRNARTRALAPGPGSTPLDRRGDGARGLPVARLDRPWSVLFGGLSGASGRPGRGVLGVLADPRRGTHRGATCPQSTTYTAGGDPTDLATCTLTMCIACILGRATDAIVCSRTGTVNVSWRRSTVFGTFAGPCLRLGVLPSHAARCNLTAVPDGPSGVGDRWGCMRKRVCSVQAAQAPPTRQHHGTLSIWRWNWPYSCPYTTRCDAALLPALGSALVPDTVREHQARASRQLRARIAAAAYHQSGVPDWGRLLTAGLGHGRHGTLLLDDTTPQGHPPAPSAILSAWSTWLHTMDALHALDDLLAVRWPPWSMCFRMR